MSKQWENKERRDSKTFNTRRTPRSGGLWWAKGDSKGKDFLIENKTTANESFSITAKIWEKISKEAVMESRMPLLSVEFGKKKHEVIVIDKNDWETFLNVLDLYRNGEIDPIRIDVLEIINSMIPPDDTSSNIERMSEDVKKYTGVPEPDYKKEQDDTNRIIEVLENHRMMPGKVKND